MKPLRQITLGLLLALALLRSVAAQSVVRPLPSHPCPPRGGPSARTPAASSLERLLQLIQARLDLATPVAQAKWNTRSPIEDRLRENQILLDLGKLAPAYGLEPSYVESFFRSQIEASKMIQRALFEDWTVQSQPPFDSVPNLGRDIRPRLDELTPQLLEALRDSQPLLGDPEALQERAAIIWGGLDPARAEALRGLVVSRGWFTVRP